MSKRSDGTDLAASATELLARNALEALRGPMSRGAVPTAALAEKVNRPRTSVSREIDRQTGLPGATAFDLVVSHAFDPDTNGQRPRWESVLSSYIASQGPPGLSVESTFSPHGMKKMLGDAFTSTAAGRSRTHLLVGYLLHVAALLAESSDGSAGSAGSSGSVGSPGSPESTRTANCILELRSETYTRSTALYASALQFMLSATRRRPKGERTVEDIVVMLHSLYDGYYLRHTLDPERYPLALVVDALWDMTVVSTEPGFLASGEGSSQARDALILATLEIVRDESVMPDLERAASAAGLDDAAVADEFSEVGELAEACLERLCAQAVKLRALAAQTNQMACWTLREFLGWLEFLVREYRPIVAATTDAKVWVELNSLIDMLILSVADSLNPATRKEIAQQLVDAVRNGSDWEPALSVLLNVLESAQGVDPAGNVDGSSDGDGSSVHGSTVGGRGCGGGGGGGGSTASVEADVCESEFGVGDLEILEVGDFEPEEEGRQLA